MAREKTQAATQILRAGSSAKSSRYVSPVTGVQGVGGMEAGAATPFLPIAPTPWRLFGSFLPVQKGTRRRGGETLSVKRTTQRPDEGIGPYEIEAHARHSQKTSQSDHRPLIRLA